MARRKVTTRLDVVASLEGALAMLTLAEQSLAAFRAAYPEIKNRVLTRAGIALQSVRLMVEQAVSSNNQATVEARRSAKLAVRARLKISPGANQDIVRTVAAQELAKGRRGYLKRSSRRLGIGERRISDILAQKTRN